MTLINIEDIKRDLAAYLQRVEAGETLMIVQAGKPVAELKPVEPEHSLVRPFGLCAGEFTMPDDFDHPLPEAILDELKGR